MSPLKAIKRFVRDDRGQSTTEYILILSVVVLVALKFKREFGGDGGVLSRLIGNVSKDIDGFSSNTGSN